MDRPYHLPISVCPQAVKYPLMIQKEEEESYGLPVCGSSNVHAQSPLGATDTEIRFCLKPFQGPYYRSANSKGECAYAQAHCAYAQARLSLSRSLM